MKQQNQNDKWVTRIGLTTLILLQWVGPDGPQVPHTKTELLNFLFSVLGISFIWLLTFLIVIRFRKLYPSIEQSVKRILLTGLVSLVIIYPFNIIILYSGTLPGQAAPPMSTMDLIRYATGVGIMLWIITGMYEACYYQQLLRQSQKEKNDLLNQQMHQQLDSLKHKVNPHFLFNNLNTLTYLIYENSALAEHFVEELSTVYRYLLRNHDEGMTSLQQEYAFIRSYMELLKIRFGQNLHLALEIEEQWMQHELPPLSLQVLVENAVKHNILSAEQPLFISISTEDQYLLVRNNYQPRHLVAATERSGLNYIISRYKQAGIDGVDIWQQDGIFTVKLPLLVPQDSQEKETAYMNIKPGTRYA